MQDPELLVVPTAMARYGDGPRIRSVDRIALSRQQQCSNQLSAPGPSHGCLEVALKPRFAHTLTQVNSSTSNVEGNARSLELPVMEVVTPPTVLAQQRLEYVPSSDMMLL